ncbi:MAG: serine/threonine protein kinase [Planctomycetaceae bacterium]|nr:serine/threonine protein kinase [Planctomycetaceae bacterium]
MQVNRQVNEQPWDGSDEQATREWEQSDSRPLGAESVWSSGHITVTIHSGEDHDTDADSPGTEVRDIPTDFLQPALHPELMGRLGRYDIEQTIGAGGFGIVFKAYDSELRRVVAVKALSPHLMSSGAARKRFAREAQAAAAIMHEHVVPIYDVVSQPDACYLVMQYVAGLSLQERVDRHGPLGIAEVLRIGAQIAAGLHAAHQQGLVHRDVKPANILLEETVERVMISDFGLARTADDANLTRSGAITGTPHYMSPEQASGALVDTRSDLFSLGSVLYFACTGRPAFRAPQIVAVLNRICNFPHRRVTEVNPEIPGPLADLIDRLLAKNPEHRIPTARDVELQLRQLLADWQSGKMVASIPTSSVDLTTEEPFLAEPTERVISDTQRSAPNLSQQKLSVPWWGGAVAMVLGLGAIVAWSGGNQSWPWVQKTRIAEESNAGTDPSHTNDSSASANNASDAIAIVSPNQTILNDHRGLQMQNFVMQLQFESDPSQLELEMEVLSRQWQWQDEELGLLLEYLQEKHAAKAVKQ